MVQLQQTLAYDIEEIIEFKDPLETANYLAIFKKTISTNLGAEDYQEYSWLVGIPTNTPVNWARNKKVISVTRIDNNLRQYLMSM